MTEKQKKICTQHSARDESGKVHCCDCPLVLDREMMMCRRNAVYNRKTRRWESKGQHDESGRNHEKGAHKTGLITAKTGRAGRCNG